jgi:hypothetical protein
MREAWERPTSTRAGVESLEEFSMAIEIFSPRKGSLLGKKLGTPKVPGHPSP